MRHSLLIFAIHVHYITRVAVYIQFITILHRYYRAFMVYKYIPYTQCNFIVFVVLRKLTKHRLYRCVYGRCLSIPNERNNDNNNINSNDNDKQVSFVYLYIILLLFEIVVNVPRRDNKRNMNLISRVGFLIKISCRLSVASTNVMIVWDHVLIIVRSRFAGRAAPNIIYTNKTHEFDGVSCTLVMTSYTRNDV